MASRIVHMAIAANILPQAGLIDESRFLLGSVLPDAGPHDISHRKLYLPDGRRTHDLSSFRRDFPGKLLADGLYLGFYLHLLQDILFRRYVYLSRHWNPYGAGNIERLHNDYALANRYIIDKYRLTGKISLPDGIEGEPLFSGAAYGLQGFIDDLNLDFTCRPSGEYYFFTPEMADEFISIAIDGCMEELASLAAGGSSIDEIAIGWGK